jgi:hypothetical protein
LFSEYSSLSSCHNGIKIINNKLKSSIRQSATQRTLKVCFNKYINVNLGE